MITLGNEDNITLKVGTETVVAVYMGTEQVYPDTPPTPINWTPIDYITCSDLIEKMRFQGNPSDIANLSDIAISQTACGTPATSWYFSDIMNYIQPDDSFVIDFYNEIQYYPSIVSLRGFPPVDTLERLKTEAMRYGIRIDVVIYQ